MAELPHAAVVATAGEAKPSVGPRMCRETVRRQLQAVGVLADRDGLQNEAVTVPTTRKLRLLEALAAAGGPAGLARRTAGGRTAAYDR